MTKINGVCRDVCGATEFVTIVTMGDDGPHVVGNWGDYMRVLGIKENMIVFPAGRYHQTESAILLAPPVPANTGMKAPPGWAADKLTKFLDAARSNQWATFWKKPSEVGKLIAIDAQLVKVSKD